MDSSVVEATDSPLPDMFFVHDAFVACTLFRKALLCRVNQMTKAPLLFALDAEQPVSDIKKLTDAFKWQSDDSFVTWTHSNARIDEVGFNSPLGTFSEYLNKPLPGPDSLNALSFTFNVQS